MTITKAAARNSRQNRTTGQAGAATGFSIVGAADARAARSPESDRAADRGAAALSSVGNMAARAGEGAERGQASAPPPTQQIFEVPGVNAAAKVLCVEPGLYAVTIGPGVYDRLDKGLELPSTQVTAVACNQAEAAKMFDTDRAPRGYIGPNGGTVVIEAPEGGAYLIVTTFRDSAKEHTSIAIQLGRLDRPDLAGASASSGGSRPKAAAGASSPASAASKAPIELVAHFATLGDVRAAGGEWAGQRGARRRVEAFSISAQGGLAPTDLEYKAYGPGGRETPWLRGDALCGKIGGDTALTAIAVRLADHVRDRFGVSYEASFFDGGVRAGRDGELCASSRFEDPVEALRVTVTSVSS